MRPLTRRTLGAALVGCLILSGCSEDPVTKLENQPATQLCADRQLARFNGSHPTKAAIDTECEDGLAFKDEQLVRAQNSPVPVVTLDGSDPPAATGEFNVTGWNENGPDAAFLLYSHRHFDVSTDTRHWTKISEPETIQTQSVTILIPFLRGSCVGIGDRGTVKCHYSIIVNNSVSHAVMFSYGGNVGYDYNGNLLLAQGKVGVQLSADVREAIIQTGKWTRQAYRDIVPKDNQEDAVWFGHTIEVTITDMQQRIWDCQQSIGTTETCSERTPQTFSTTTSLYTGVIASYEADRPRLTEVPKTEGTEYELMSFGNSPYSEATEGGYTLGATVSYQHERTAKAGGKVYGQLSFGTPVAQHSGNVEVRGERGHNTTDSTSVEVILDVRVKIVETDLEPLFMHVVPIFSDDVHIGVRVRPR